MLFEEVTLLSSNNFMNHEQTIKILSSRALEPGIDDMFLKNVPLLIRSSESVVSSERLVNHHDSSFASRQLCKSSVSPKHTLVRTGKAR